MSPLFPKRSPPIERRYRYREGPDLDKYMVVRDALIRNALATFPKLLEWAETGSPNAAYLIGYAYFVGRGTSVDLEKAETWLLRASSAGAIDARYYLGLLYLRLRRNEDALAAFMHCAKCNYSPCFYYLGRIHLLGFGTPKDVAKAKGYLERGSQLGNVWSKRLLAWVLMHHSRGIGNWLRGSKLIVAAYVKGSMYFLMHGDEDERIRG